MSQILQSKNPHVAYEVINPQGTADIVFICEHASNHIPAEFNNLGLEEDCLEQHIAWDIGMEKMTRRLCEILDAPAIIANFSRLLIDPNREENQAGLIPHTSDSITIPGNQNLSPEQIKERIERFYRPFHASCDQLIRNKVTNAHMPLICGMHSFTPRMKGYNRPWQAGMLWNKDPRLALALINTLEARGFHVGDNKPYSGRDLFHTMNQHGHHHGAPHVTIEVRQDLVSNNHDINNWVEIFSEDLSMIANDPTIRLKKHY